MKGKDTANFVAILDYPGIVYFPLLLWKVKKIWNPGLYSVCPFAVPRLSIVCEWCLCRSLHGKWLVPFALKGLRTFQTRIEIFPRTVCRIQCVWHHPWPGHLIWSSSLLGPQIPIPLLATHRESNFNRHVLVPFLRLESRLIVKTKLSHHSSYRMTKAIKLNQDFIATKDKQVFGLFFQTTL